MIVELFGLPGSGKSTHSRAWRAEGVPVIRALSRSELVFENIRFLLRYPLKAVRLLVLILRHAPAGRHYTLFMNAFLVQNAKFIRAKRLSRKGQLVGIDQGHFQLLLSLFESKPSTKVLASIVRMVPKPDLLIIPDVPKEERIGRMRERGWRPRAELSEPEVNAFFETTEAIYTESLDIFTQQKVPHEVVQGNDALSIKKFVTKNISYVTAARMPTEKAHGVSIAHMCTSFAKNGAKVILIVPTRRRKLDEDLWEYYAVPRNFEFKRFYSPDFIGRGLTLPFFFFAQRLAFVFMLSRRIVPWGVVYTREPEIAWLFSSSHRAVFEAHNWPSGRWGKLQAHLLKRVTLIVCNSQGTEAAARAAGCRRTAVAPNGFDPAPFENAESKEEARSRLGIPQDARVALYVGALDARKGVQTLFDASQYLPDHTVTIIGGTQNEVAILREKYPKVRFLGYRPYREIANNLAAADVLVLPNSAKLQESAEFTSPIKLFAYMASGVPIIASDVPAVRALLNERNAILVTPDNPKMFADHFSKVLGSSVDTRPEIARADIRSYTWDTRAHSIVHGIQEVDS